MTAQIKSITTFKEGRPKLRGALLIRRTELFKLLIDCEKAEFYGTVGHKMKAVDVVSLYPATMYYDKYSVEQYENIAQE